MLRSSRASLVTRSRGRLSGLYVAGSHVLRSSGTYGGWATVPANDMVLSTVGSGSYVVNLLFSGVGVLHIAASPKASLVVNQPVISGVDYLVVAGSGGGGSDLGGGGGGGEVISGLTMFAYNEQFPVTVGTGGAGGTGSTGTTIRGANGGNSQLGTITAKGGGGGAGYPFGGVGAAGSAGGSGGGGSAVGGAGGAASAAGGGRVSAGGPGVGGGATANGGGGGGAGGVGSAGIAVAGQPGNGGAGIASSITGVGVFYGGGGGGAANNATIAAGYGNGAAGGGNGGRISSSGGNGAANTGSGGGGGGNAATYPGVVGGNGGSGIVVVAYLNTYPDLAIGNGLTFTKDIVTRASYKVFKFLSGTGNIASPASTYTGGTHIYSGTVVATGPNSFGTGPITVDKGATLDRGGFTLPNVIINNGGTII